MQVTCPACQKTSESKADISGKSVKCGCGKSFVVPPEGSGTRPQKNQPAASVRLTCKCGKAHQVPLTAAGKSLKCSCGASTIVPAPARSASAAPVAAAAGSASLFQAFSDDDWASLSPKVETPTYEVEEKPKKKSNTANLMDQARKDLGETKKSARSGAGKKKKSSGWIIITVSCVLLIAAIGGGAAYYFLWSGKGA